MKTLILKLKSLDERFWRRVGVSVFQYDFNSLVDSILQFNPRPAQLAVERSEEFQGLLSNFFANGRHVRQKLIRNKTKNTSWEIYLRNRKFYA